MSRFNFCDCPAGFSAAPERHAPDCPGRSGAGKAPTPVPATQPLEPAHARAETKCDECQGDGHYWLAGASAHPSNRHACEPCKGTGKQLAPVVGQNLRAELDRVTAKRDALQRRLTTADQRVDTLESLLERVLTNASRAMPSDLCKAIRALFPVPSSNAPANEAEREPFESWHRSKFATRHSTGQPTRDMHNGIHDPNYGPPDQQHMWEAWQARAAMEQNS